MRLLLAFLLICGFVVGGDLQNEKEQKPFAVYDITTKPDGGNWWKVRGQIKNNSGKDYRNTVFRISFFDEEEKLTGTTTFQISNFTKGEEVVFEENSKDNLAKWVMYRIRLESSY